MVTVTLVGVVMAALCDWLENAGINATLNHFKQNSSPKEGDARRISTPSIFKWTLLAIVLLVLGSSAFVGSDVGSWVLEFVAWGGLALGVFILYTILRYALARFWLAPPKDEEAPGALRFDAVLETERQEILLVRGARFTEIALEILERKDADENARQQAQKLYDALKAVFQSYDSVLSALDAYWNDPSPNARDALSSTLHNVGNPPRFAKQIAFHLNYRYPSERMTFGLALSGGGIRSATFNLGILQGLAQYNLLPYFDYLSTVSGGGYIGSSLVVWIKRKGLGVVNRQLKPDWQEHNGKEPSEIEFLRSYSNYLTPKLGLFSADT